MRKITKLLKCVVCLVPFYSHSAQLEIVEQLDFGTVVVTNNSTVSTSRVFRSGQQHSTNKLLIVTKGRPALIRLFDFSPYRTLTISATLPFTSVMPYPGTAQFSIVSVDAPSSVVTNSLGEAQFYLGATIATSGDGLPYYNQATYAIDIYIDFNYL